MRDSYNIPDQREAYLPFLIKYFEIWGDGLAGKAHALHDEDLSSVFRTQVKSEAFWHMPILSAWGERKRWVPGISQPVTLAYFSSPLPQS